MDWFYRQARRETGILMEREKPQGGKFSYDVENRLPWKGKPPAPESPAFRVDSIKAEVESWLSKGGTFAAGATGVDERQACEIVLVHPVHKYRLILKAEVAWIREQEPGKGIAVQLSDFGPEVVQRIRAFVMSQPPEAEKAAPPPAAADADVPPPPTGAADAEDGPLPDTTAEAGEVTEADEAGDAAGSAASGSVRDGSAAAPEATSDRETIRTLAAHLSDRH